MFAPKSIFCNFKNDQKSIFELGKSLKLPKMQFHKKKIFIWFHEFFCLDFFKFSGPLCNVKWFTGSRTGSPIAKKVISGLKFWGSYLNSLAVHICQFFNLQCSFQTSGKIKPTSHDQEAFFLIQFLGKAKNFVIFF